MFSPSCTVGREMADDIMERPFQGSLVMPGSAHSPLDPSKVPSASVSKKDSPDFFDEKLVRRKVAKLIVFGFRGKSVNSHARELISLGSGGVILFRRNVEDPFQLAELCTGLKQEAGNRHLITMIDQEGGLVQRVGPPFTSVPAPRRVGMTGDAKAAGAIGSVLGKELRTLHIDMNLAPVLDVDTNPSNPLLLGRSFGSCPELVAEMGYEFIRALQREGVAACAKHYPGLGSTSLDSHLGLPALSRTLDELSRTEIPPFHRAVEADTAAIMMGHVDVSSFTANGSKNEKLLPASLSFEAIRYLRDELFFEGLILSDSLEMGAIMKHYKLEDAAVQAVLAGVDMLLVCHSRVRQLQIIDRLTEAVREGVLPYDRIEEAGQRVDNLADMYCRKAVCLCSPFEEDYQMERMMMIGCKEHQNVVANVVHHIALADEASMRKN